MFLTLLESNLLIFILIILLTILVKFQHTILILSSLELLSIVNFFK